jgi:hypothetical protein
MVFRTILDALGLDEGELWEEASPPGERLRRELDLRFRRLIRLRTRIERVQKRLRTNEQRLQRPGLSIQDLEATHACIAQDRFRLQSGEEAYQYQLTGFTHARRRLAQTRATTG